MCVVPQRRTLLVNIHKLKVLQCKIGGPSLFAGSICDGEEGVDGVRGLNDFRLSRSARHDVHSASRGAATSVCTDSCKQMCSPACAQVFLTRRRNRSGVMKQIKKTYYERG